jgi:polyisoprenoid-binding protein YceI
MNDNVKAIAPIGRPMLLAALALFAAVSSVSAAETEYEQLLVFLQPDKSVVDQTFQADQLPAIRQVADAMGVSVHIVPIDRGAPPEVALTPLLVYQNHRGRSIYQGRTTTPDRVRNFIRTSRFVPQGDARNRREQIPVWTLGRERIWAPLKVAAVTGTPPAGYDDGTFKKEALKAIAQGFNHFQVERQALLGRADRGFYMDFYPWRADDGTLFLSLALYSQFHCKEPIFEKKQNPLTGPWEQRQALFSQAAALMEKQIAIHIKQPDNGDAFAVVAADVPILSWEQAGYPLPPVRPQQAIVNAAAARLTSNWILAASDPDAPPMIQFRFAAPLDNYAGEVKTGRGTLRLDQTLVLEGAEGHIEIDTQSAITMGDPVLDEAIQGSLLLGARNHPQSRFTIESLSSDGRPIVFGQLSPAQITGIFQLKGKSMPLAAPAEFEPVIGADGRPRLIVRTAFGIDLRDFDIEGADGPEPARHTLFFDVNLQFAPKPKP